MVGENFLNTREVGEFVYDVFRTFAEHVVMSPTNTTTNVSLRISRVDKPLHLEIVFVCRYGTIISRDKTELESAHLFVLFSFLLVSLRQQTRK